MEGCGKPKKYACSKTNIPLCSLACYKKNMALADTSRLLELHS